MSDRERAAYSIWCGTTSGQPSKEAAVAFFRLYLNGQTCQQIQEQNSHYSLGQIIAARVEWEWDIARDEYRRALLADTSARLQQATMETVGLLCDTLAVAAKQHGTKMRRYLQSGNEEDLKGCMVIDSLKNLKAVAESVAKLKGVEERPAIPGDVPAAAASLPPVDQPITPSGAADALKFLLGRVAPSKEN